MGHVGTRDKETIQTSLRDTCEKNTLIIHTLHQKKCWDVLGWDKETIGRKGRGHLIEEIIGDTL